MGTWIRNNFMKLTALENRVVIAKEKYLIFYDHLLEKREERRKKNYSAGDRKFSYSITTGRHINLLNSCVMFKYSRFRFDRLDHCTNFISTTSWDHHHEQ